MFNRIRASPRGRYARRGVVSLLVSVEVGNGCTTVPLCATFQGNCTLRSARISLLMDTDVIDNKQLNGGEGGIRTPDSLATMSDFESGAFNRALPPLRFVFNCLHAAPNDARKLPPVLVAVSCPCPAQSARAQVRTLSERFAALQHPHSAKAEPSSVYRRTCAGCNDRCRGLTCQFPAVPL
jgi:hypothetical protein